MVFNETFNCRCQHRGANLLVVTGYWLKPWSMCLDGSDTVRLLYVTDECEEERRLFEQ